MCPSFVNEELWDIISDSTTYLKTTEEYFRMLRRNVPFDYLHDANVYFELACALPLKTFVFNGISEWFEKRNVNPWLKFSYSPIYTDRHTYMHHEYFDDDHTEIFLVDFSFGDARNLYYSNMMRFLVDSSWEMELAHWISFDPFDFFYVVLHCFCLSGKSKTWITRDEEDGMQRELPFRYFTLCPRCHSDFKEHLTAEIPIHNNSNIDVDIDRLNSVYEIHQRTYCFNMLVTRGGYTHFLRILQTEKDLLWCNRCGIQCFMITTDESTTDNPNRYNEIPTNQDIVSLFQRYHIDAPLPNEDELPFAQPE